MPAPSDDLKAKIKTAMIAIDAAAKALKDAKDALAAVSGEPGGGVAVGDANG